MIKKELPNDWKPDLKPKTELEQKKLDIQKEIMQLENQMRFIDEDDRLILDTILKIFKKLEALQ